MRLILVVLERSFEKHKNARKTKHLFKFNINLIIYDMNLSQKPLDSGRLLSEQEGGRKNRHHRWTEHLPPIKGALPPNSGWLRLLHTSTDFFCHLLVLRAEELFGDWKNLSNWRNCSKAEDAWPNNNHIIPIWNILFGPESAYQFGSK